MIGKRILMVFIPLICIIGGVRANYNYELIRIESPDSYSEIPFSDETVIRKYLKMNENLPISFKSENTYSDFQQYDPHLLMGSGGMNGDPDGGGMGEYDDSGESEGGIGGNPAGPGVGELPLSDGLLVLLFLACLYILWKPLGKHFRRYGIIQQRSLQKTP
jgi:hypothetical protein